MLCLHNITRIFFVKNFSRCYIFAKKINLKNRKSVWFYRNCSHFVCVLEGSVCLYFDLYQQNSFIENIYYGNFVCLSFKAIQWDAWKMNRSTYLILNVQFVLIFNFISLFLSFFFSFFLIFFINNFLKNNSINSTLETEIKCIIWYIKLKIIYMVFYSWNNQWTVENKMRNIT